MLHPRVPHQWLVMQRQRLQFCLDPVLNLRLSLCVDVDVVAVSINSDSLVAMLVTAAIAASANWRTFLILRMLSGVLWVLRIALHTIVLCPPGRWVNCGGHKTKYAHQRNRV